MSKRVAAGGTLHLLKLWLGKSFMLLETLNDNGGARSTYIYWLAFAFSIPKNFLLFPFKETCLGFVQLLLV